MSVNTYNAVVSILLLMLIGRTDSQCPEESAGRLPFLSLRQSNHTTTFDNSDQFLQTNWYSAYGILGQYQMVDKTSIPFEGCGTFYPIYLNDVHPAYDDISEGEEITNTACLVSFTSVCDKEYTVKIRKCNARLEYYLESTIAVSAFCFNLAIGIGDRPRSPDDAVPTSVQVRANLVYTKLERLSSGQFYKHPELRFKCKFEMNTTYFYYAYWYINNNFILEKGPSQTEADLYISEPEIMAAGYTTLGFTIKCGIRVASAIDGALTDIKKSDGFFAGIKVHTNVVTMKKTDKVPVLFEPTVPVGCDHTDKALKSGNYVCYHDVLMIDANKTDEYTCQESVVAVEDNFRCGKQIQGSVNETVDDWVGQNYTMNIQTTAVTYNDKDVFTMLLRMSEVGRGHFIWQKYLIDFIRVRVIDDQNWQRKYCRSVVDPHVTTFDGLAYENQIKGEYILYRNEEQNIEVQEKTERCNHNRATCACAVTVRAGGDIFTVHLCGGQKLVTFLACDEGVLDVRLLSDKLTYQVFTPIGTYVNIRIVTSYPKSIYWNFLNVAIYMSPRDVGKASGLCGNGDNDMSNDLAHRYTNTISDAVRHSHPTDFTSSWRISEAESFLTASNRHQDKYEEEYTFCVCEAALSNSQIKALSTTAICSKTESQLCSKNLNMEEGSIQKTCKIRNKKSTSLYHAEIYRRLNLAKENSHHLEKRSETSDEPVAILQSTIDKCSNFLLGSFLAANMTYLDQAVNDSIYSCAFDVTVSEEEDFMKQHKRINDVVAKNLIRRDPKFKENNKDTLDMFAEQSCLCRNNGICKSDKCICPDGYIGADCSINKAEGPDISYIQYDGLCDTTEVSDCSCFSAQAYNLFQNFYAHITTKQTMTDFKTTISEAQLICEPEDMFNGICCVPPVKKKRSVGSQQMFITAYEITFSIDGINFGSGKTMYVFDSSCQEYTDVNGTRSFYLKAGYCFIDGMCVADTVSSTYDKCNKCLTNVNAYSWTSDCTSSSSSADGSNTLIIASCVAGAVAIICVLSLFFCICIKYKLQQRSLVSTLTPALQNTQNVGSPFNINNMHRVNTPTSQYGHDNAKRTKFSSSNLTEADLLTRPSRPGNINLNITDIQ